MDLGEMKKTVVAANKELPKQHLVKYSWGNVSSIDRKKGLIVIKPVGIPYDELTEENISVTDLDGKVISGPYNPSVDLPIHIVLFKAFSEINSIYLQRPEIFTRRITSYHERKTGFQQAGAPD